MVENRRSIAPKNIATAALAPITTAVYFSVSCRVGQFTRCNSATTSLKKLESLLMFLVFKNPPRDLIPLILSLKFSMSNQTYISKFLTSLAWVWMNFFRGGTSLPIKISKISSASAASRIVTLSSTRLSGFIVVSHSCSGFISPKPL